MEPSRFGIIISRTNKEGKGSSNNLLISMEIKLLTKTKKHCTKELRRGF
jgi:hypothetical protein